MNDRDKANLIPTARGLAGLGFHLVATRGTARALRAAGLEVDDILKVSEGRPNGVDGVINDEIDLILNTPLGNRSFSDEHVLRQVAIANGVPVLTHAFGGAGRHAGHRGAARGDHHRGQPAGALCPPGRLTAALGGRGREEGQD